MNDAYIARMMGRMSLSWSVSKKNYVNNWLLTKLLFGSVFANVIAVFKKAVF